MQDKKMHIQKETRKSEVLTARKKGGDEGESFVWQGKELMRRAMKKMKF